MGFYSYIFTYYGKKCEIIRFSTGGVLRQYIIPFWREKIAMIHFEAVEKSAQRIHTYLNDPAAFGERLNANRKEKLEALYSLLIESAKLLGTKLGKSDIISDSTEAVIKSAVEEMAKRMQPTSISTSSIPTVAVESVEIKSDSTTDPSTTVTAQKKNDKPIPVKSCKWIYAMFIQTLRVGVETRYSDPMLDDYTSFIWEHFTFRFARGEKYNIHQIQECITKMFVVFAHGYYSGDRLTFESQYTVWKRMYETSESKYIYPAYVSCFNIEILSDEEKEYIKSEWRDLVEGPFSPITRVNIGDNAIRDTFLLSNPFRAWETADKKKEVQTATL